MTSNSSIARIFVPLVLLLVGVGLIAVGARNLLQIASFPEVPAVVEQVDYKYRSMTERKSELRQVVTVKYTVDGKEYTEELQFARQKVQKGDTVSVRYDPKDPSYVTAGNAKTGALYLAFGAFIAIGGAVTIVQLLRGKRE